MSHDSLMKNVSPPWEFPISNVLYAQVPKKNYKISLVMLRINGWPRVNCSMNEKASLLQKRTVVLFCSPHHSFTAVSVAWEPFSRVGVTGSHSEAHTGMNAPNGCGDRCDEKQGEQKKFRRTHSKNCRSKNFGCTRSSRLTIFSPPLLPSIHVITSAGPTGSPLGRI